MPIDNFKTLSFVPLPLLDLTKEHYRPFSDLYATIPQDNRPSLQLGQSEGHDIDREHRELFRNTRARNCITCQECLKPRIIYSASKTSREQNIAVAQVVESQLYICGSALFGPTSPYHSTIVVRQALRCRVLFCNASVFPPCALPLRYVRRTSCE